MNLFIRGEQKMCDISSRKGISLPLSFIRKVFFSTEDVLTSLERKLLLKFTKQQRYLKSFWRQKTKKCKEIEFNIKSKRWHKSSGQNINEMCKQIVPMTTILRATIFCSIYKLHCVPFIVSHLIYDR